MNVNSAESHVYLSRTSLDTQVLPNYLLRWGILSPAQVVEENLKVEDISRRNRNFRVRTEKGWGFLVKQPLDRDGGAARGIEREARIMRLVAHEPAFQDLREHVPEFVLYDAPNCILATRLIHPATSITKLHLHYGEIDFNPDVAQSAGRLLGLFHDDGLRVKQAGHFDFLAKHPPNGLSIMNEQQFVFRGPAGAAYWERIKQGTYLKQLKGLVANWNQCQGVVHADARWDNYLVSAGEGKTGNINLRLIDWEMARVGDSFWDVVSFLGDYIRFSLVVNSIDGRRTSKEIIDDPKPAFEGHHESAREFIRAYMETRRLGAQQRDRLRKKICDYMPFYCAMVGWELTLARLEVGTSRTMIPAAEAALVLADRAAVDPHLFLDSMFGLKECFA